MKRALLAVMLSISPIFSFAGVTEVPFPRKLECFTPKEIGAYVGGKYKEKVLLVANTMNSKDPDSVMVFTYNIETKTYTIIVEYPKDNLACVVDSGLAEINLEAVFGKKHKL